jgi:hypothetical protein
MQLLTLLTETTKHRFVTQHGGLQIGCLRKPIINHNSSIYSFPFLQARNELSFHVRLYPFVHMYVYLSCLVTSKPKEDLYWIWYVCHAIWDYSMFVFFQILKYTPHIIIGKSDYDLHRLTLKQNTINVQHGMTVSKANLSPRHNQNGQASWINWDFYWYTYCTKKKKPRCKNID